MSTLTDCIVTFIDMIGVRELLEKGSPKAVSLMMQMHAAIPKAAKEFSSDTEICFWNDSVLVHTPVDGSEDNSEKSFADAMRPLPILKAAVDNVRKSYAICVKGKSFRPPANSTHLKYLSASSLALTNCDQVHKELKEYKMDWYIDSRIMRQVDHSLFKKEDDKKKVHHLYPKRSGRMFYMFRGSFTRQD